MQRYTIIAGLLLGLVAMAQTSTTPGVPEPSNTRPPAPQATAPDQQSSPDQDRDRDRSSSDQQQYPDAQSQKKDRDQIQTALQQRSNLAGVNVDEAESRLVLSGSVASEQDRREAESIAQSYAHGRQVVNHIQISGSSQPRSK